MGTREGELHYDDTVLRGLAEDCRYVYVISYIILQKAADHGSSSAVASAAAGR